MKVVDPSDVVTVQVFKKFAVSLLLEFTLTVHVLRKVTGIQVPQDPTYILLNHRINHTPKCTQLIFFMCSGAKITLAKAWKKRASILATERKISWIMTQEQTVANVLDTVQRFEKVWEPWASRIKIPLYPGHLHT